MKFLSALESSRPRKQPKTPTKGVPPATISISTTPVEFDAFMRSMSRVKALGNARHHRADIDREIRRATDLKRHATDAVEARRLHDHIERLLKARHVIETRIAYLAGAELVNPLFKLRITVLTSIRTSPPLQAQLILQSSQTSRLVRFSPTRPQRRRGLNIWIEEVEWSSSSSGC